MNISLIIAGGKGIRMGQDIPKQFIEINEKPIIAYTLEAYQNNKNTDAIVVVCIADWEDVVQACAYKYGITKLKCIINGGSTRLQSTYNGLMGMSNFAKNDDIVMIHDAIRPLVDNETIDEGILTYKKTGSLALSAAPCYDSMYKKQSDGTIVAINRNDLFKGHSPETFSYGGFMSVYTKANEEKLDKPASELFLYYGYNVVASKSTDMNIKLTTKEDLEIFKSLLSLRAKTDFKSK